MSRQSARFHSSFVKFVAFCSTSSSRQDSRLRIKSFPRISRLTSVRRAFDHSQPVMSRKKNSLSRPHGHSLVDGFTRDVVFRVCSEHPEPVIVVPTDQRVFRSVIRDCGIGQ